MCAYLRPIIVALMLQILCSYDMFSEVKHTKVNPSIKLCDGYEFVVIADAGVTNESLNIVVVVKPVGGNAELSSMYFELWEDGRFLARGKIERSRFEDVSTKVRNRFSKTVSYFQISISKRLINESWVRFRSSKETACFLKLREWLQDVKAGDSQ